MIGAIVADRTLRAVFFDMGGTLVTYEGRDDPWHAPVMQAIEREFGNPSWAEPLYAADIRHPPDGDPHRQQTNRWLAEWLASRGERLGPDAIEKLRKAFARPLPEGFQLARGAADAIAWCKAHGLGVAVLTNTLSRGDEEVRADFMRLGLSDSIDHVLSSYTTGWEKPHPAMFERALDLAGIASAQACMVGDSPELDIAGAKSIGMRAIWVRIGTGWSGRGPLPDAAVDSLEELPRLLGPWLGTELGLAR
jgi:putative hydrolase of the HAD superfamily